MQVGFPSSQNYVFPSSHFSGPIIRFWQTFLSENFNIYFLSKTNFFIKLLIKL